MRAYLYPVIKRADFKPITILALLGGLLGGCYGVVHDLITFSISAEYFTKLKFHQFHYADLGLGDHLFAGTIGFFATWWVGLIAAWLLARRFVPNQPRPRAYRQVALGALSILLCGMLFGVAGYLYGLRREPDADYAAWEWALQRYNIDDRWSFVRVAYIHNGGYAGAVVGLLIALIAMQPIHDPGDTSIDTGNDSGLNA